jgi:hypothetical protein
MLFLVFLMPSCVSVVLIAEKLGANLLLHELNGSLLALNGLASPNLLKANHGKIFVTKLNLLSLVA